MGLRAYKICAELCRFGYVGLRAYEICAELYRLGYVGLRAYEICAELCRLVIYSVSIYAMIWNNGAWLGCIIKRRVCGRGYI